MSADLPMAVASPPSQAGIVAFEPAPIPGEEVTVRHVESILGEDGVFRPTGRVFAVTYRKVVTAASIETGES